MAKKKSFTVKEKHIEDYIPDAANANLGSERGAAMIEDSLSQDGAGRSLVADKDGRLVAGNKTQEGAINAGITKVIEIETDGDALIVHKRRDWNLDDLEGAARRYAYRDNRSSDLNLTWNTEQIALDLEAGVDLSRMFSEVELTDLGIDLNGTDTPDDPGADMNRADELQEKWKVQPGDLYQVGLHKVLCGDSTKAEDVKRLMGGEKADAVVTDPPYGIAHNTDYTRFTGGISASHQYESIKNDIDTFDPSHLLCYETVILWGANNYPQYLVGGSVLVWDKRNEGQSKLMSDGEIAWLNQGHGVYIFNHAWNGFDRATERGVTLHPTQKPVELFVWCIERIKSQLIFDPYCGSGPVMAACEQLNRRGYGIEIVPKYVSVILERLTGLGLSVTKVSEVEKL